MRVLTYSCQIQIEDFFRILYWSQNILSSQEKKNPYDSSSLFNTLIFFIQLCYIVIFDNLNSPKDWQNHVSVFGICTESIKMYSFSNLKNKHKRNIIIDVWIIQARPQPLVAKTA